MSEVDKKVARLRKPRFVGVKMSDALKKRIDREAKRYEVTFSDLVRKKLEAVEMKDSPVVRLIDNKGVRVLRIDFPFDEFLKSIGRGSAKRGRK